MEANPCSLFSGSRYSELSGKSVPPTMGTGHPTHYLLLGMK